MTFNLRIIALNLGCGNMFQEGDMSLTLYSILAQFSTRVVTHTANKLGPLYTTPGCFLPRVESTRRVTLLQSNVSKRLHENSSQAGSAPLAR